MDAVRHRHEFDTTDAYALGEELGVARSSVARALDDFRSLPDEHSNRGPAAVAVGVIPSSPSTVAAAIDLGLRQRSMDRCRLYGSSCWHQRRDWWPDIKRFGFAPSVHVDVRRLDEGDSLLRLRTPVGLLRWLYVFWALVAAVIIGVAVGAAVNPATGLAAGVATTAAGGAAYRRRVEAIRWRLAVFVDELIQPNSATIGFETAGQTRPEMLSADRPSEAV